jgi:hypothetical protein
VAENACWDLTTSLRYLEGKREENGGKLLFDYRSTSYLSSGLSKLVELGAYPKLS